MRGGLVDLRELGPDGEVGPQPALSLLPQAGVLLVVGLVGVLPLAATGLGGGVGGIEAVLLLYLPGQLRVVSKGLGVKVRGGGVELLGRLLAHIRQCQPLGVIGRLIFTLEQSSELLLQCDQLFRLPQPHGGRIRPIGLFGTEFMALA